MSPKITKILLASDLSPTADHALDYAFSIAEHYKAQLLVLHVFESVSSNPYLQYQGIKSAEAWQALQQDKEVEIMRELEENLKAVCAEKQDGLTLCRVKGKNILLRKGVPMEEILNTAQEQGVDLIIIGTHGYGPVKDTLMGGTARRVVRRSKIPVLVVHGVKS